MFTTRGPCSICGQTCLLFDVASVIRQSPKLPSTQTVGLMAETCLSHNADLASITDATRLLLSYWYFHGQERRQYAAGSRQKFCLLYCIVLYMNQTAYCKNAHKFSAPRCRHGFCFSSGVRLPITSIQTDRSHTEVNAAREYCVI